MTPQDRDYFLRRAIEEERAAEVAASLSARWRHEELAFLYRARASGNAPDLRVVTDDLARPGDFAL